MNNRDLNFAYRIRHALNENIDRMPVETTDKLAAARKMAMSRRKKDSPMRAVALQRSVSGHVGSFLNEPLSWLGRMGLALPVIVLALGLGGLYKLESDRRIVDTAVMDAAVLADELPLDAYLDNGFNAFLAKRD